MSNTESNTTSGEAPGGGKWADLPPAIRRSVSGDDGPPSEYGVPVGVDDHPLRRFYRDAETEAMQAGTASRTGKRIEKRGSAR